MDISTPLIFLGIFLVACVSLFVVFKYGIKEKSYEEALAEQRQQTNALLAAKTKPKEKKNKKNTKKPKDKQSPSDSEAKEEVETVSHHQKLHVAFKAEPEELVPKESSPIKRPKKDKIRPILVHKQQEAPGTTTVLCQDVVLNHFDVIHPKDALELLRSNSKEDLLAKPSEPKEAKEKPIKEKKQQEQTKKVKQPQPEQKQIVEEPIIVEKKEEKKLEAAPIVVQPASLPVNTGKEKKKKKSEFNTLQQLSAERDGLFTLVRKAELSRNEIQTLIELLLNKQHEAPTVVDDWSEGKADPVQRLKKQLAEKEKLLADEQETVAGSQSKMREMRAEHQTECAQLKRTIQQLKEELNGKQIDLDANKNRHQATLQNVQVLQAQLADEVGKTQRLIEENAALQNKLQQTEIHFAQLPDIQAERTRLHLENVALIEAENKRLAEFGALQMEIDQLTVLNKKQEESRQNLEVELANQIRIAEDLLKENAQIKTTYHQQAEEYRKLEYTLSQTEREKTISAKVIAQMQDERDGALKINQRDQDELLRANNEMRKLQGLLSRTEEELVKAREVQATQINGSAEESKNHKVEIGNLNNQLSSYVNELQLNKQNLTEATSKISGLEQKLEDITSKNNLLSDTISKDKEAQKAFIQRLFPEIDGLKSATLNDDWQSQVGQLINTYVADLKTKQRLEEQVPVVESPELAKMKAEVEKYQSIINETTGQLLNLEANVAQAEMDWRDKLSEKEQELERLKEEAATELQHKVSELEHKLAQQQSSNEVLRSECAQLKGRTQGTDAAATIERLTEEVNRLNDSLRLEQSKKNGDLNGSAKEQNFKATNGLSLIEHSLSSSSTSLTSTDVIHNKKPKNKKKKKKGNGN